MSSGLTAEEVRQEHDHNAVGRGSPDPAQGADRRSPSSVASADSGRPSVTGRAGSGDPRPTRFLPVDVAGYIATDKHGKFVRDLSQTDFSILDDNKPPQSILNFRRETDLPLHLGLLIDVSGSVHGRFAFEQDAATSFLQHSIRTGFDKAFIVGFNTQSQMSQDFTDNVQLLSAGVHKLQDGGGTALYDAIYRACKEKFLKDRPDHPARKAIVIVSDGDNVDVASHDDVDNAVGKAVHLRRTDVGLEEQGKSKGDSAMRPSVRSTASAKR